jgi:methyl-accepting chemotaxis protein PixJ
MDFSKSQIIFSIGQQIRQAEDLDSLFNVTVNEVRQVLEAERVLIYRFDGDNPRRIMAESVVRGFTPALREIMPVVSFGFDSLSDYAQRSVALFDSVATAGLTPYQLQLWERFQIQASLSLAINLNGKAWGLLVGHQCTNPRHWQESDVSLLYQLVLELAASLQPVQFQEQLQQQSQQERSLAKIINKVQQSTDIISIFQTATQEVRQLLQCDRVGVYRLNEDWSGEFIAEPVGAGWVAVVSPFNANK